MRIIAGTHRSRTILAPPDARTTRPITDRVKQSLFDLLTARELMGGHVLDLFAGTGSLGLEALSRGADRCTFVERDRSIRELLEKNLDTLGFTAQAAVLKVDSLAANWGVLVPPASVRVVFCDPPFVMTSDPDKLPRVTALIEKLADRLEPGGACVLRTETHIEPPSPVGYAHAEHHPYGSMALHLYARSETSGETDTGK
ncbi:MAG: 16S rRNA (guanine(966)-N(2))-methyltransferase RsmD [Phycisphaera sp.]|nr:16S rRNA (guanine(966)-N(2))-methyltransferase RsmD [Phycisphaera sp.]